MTSDSELTAQVRELADRAEIRECMMRYARGMDRRDREVLRSAYHDGAIDDHVGFVGEVDDFIDWAFAYHATQTRYQHYLLNHTAELVGDTAHVETYYLFVGTDREPHDQLGWPLRRPGRAARRSVGDRGQGLRRRMDHGVDVVDHRGRHRDAVCRTDSERRTAPIRRTLARWS